MTYDNYGNILTKNGVVYDYDTVWKDKLIKVGDKTITYDEQGNPTQYLGHNLTWEKGRQLKSFEKVEGFERHIGNIRVNLYNRIKDVDLVQKTEFEMRLYK